MLASRNKSSKWARRRSLERWTYSCRRTSTTCTNAQPASCARSAAKTPEGCITTPGTIAASARLRASASATLSFVFALTLRSGDTIPFAAICLASGAALGADMVLLPAIFARHLAGRFPGAEALAFGLWSFASKLALALAAFTLLPLLDAGGFTAGAQNTDAALSLLTMLYAGLPCLLKLAAVALLLATPVPEA